MTAGTVLLLRHGQTPWNVARRLQGQADIDLDDTGVAQAAYAAEQLVQLRPTAIVSSDLVRAHRTAEALADLTGLQIRLDERLRERAFGAWEGLDRPEIKQGWPEQFRIWSEGGLPEGLGVESRSAVGARVAEAVQEHAAAMDDSQVLVVVAHGAAISAGITALLGHDAGEWNGIAGLGNCHWSVLHPTHGSQLAWRLHAHNVGSVT